jgi:hypothetical protein
MILLVLSQQIMYLGTTLRVLSTTSIHFIFLHLATIPPTLLFACTTIRSSHTKNRSGKRTGFVDRAVYSRMPRVHEKDGGEIRFWKDLYRDSGRRFEELEILKKIHKGRVVPGVVQFNDELSGDMKNGEDFITTAKDDDIRNGESRRIKTRLVMESTGVELRKCHAVLEGLKVLYDILEGLIYDPGLVRSIDSFVK